MRCRMYIESVLLLLLVSRTFRGIRVAKERTTESCEREEIEIEPCSNPLSFQYNGNNMCNNMPILAMHDIWAGRWN